MARKGEKAKASSCLVVWGSVVIFLFSCFCFIEQRTKRYYIVVSVPCKLQDNLRNTGVCVFVENNLQPHINHIHGETCLQVYSYYYIQCNQCLLWHREV